MSNPSKRKGSQWEVDVVAYLRSRGWPHAERRVLQGKNDRGDVAGMPGVVVEAKSCKTFDLAGWLDEAETERANDKADLGFVWFKRRGKSDPGKGYVLMDGDTVTWLLRSAGYGQPLTEEEGNR